MATPADVARFRATQVRLEAARKGHLRRARLAATEGNYALAAELRRLAAK